MEIYASTLAAASDRAAASGSGVEKQTDDLVDELRAAKGGGYEWGVIGVRIAQRSRGWLLQPTRALTRDADLPFGNRLAVQSQQGSLARRAPTRSGGSLLLDGHQPPRAVDPARRDDR
jgi:hypothetical protein